MTFPKPRAYIPRVYSPGRVLPARVMPPPSATPPSSPARATSTSTSFDTQARSLLAGGVAGAFAKTCTAPMARLTILYQVEDLHAPPRTRSGSRAPPTATSTSASMTTDAPTGLRSRSLWQSLQSVVRSEGLASLWRGNGVTIMHRIPYSAANFWAYETLTSAITRRESAAAATTSSTSTSSTSSTPNSSSDLRTMLRRCAVGGIAGTFACAGAYPLDLVRTRLSALQLHAPPTSTTIPSTLSPSLSATLHHPTSMTTTTATTTTTPAWTATTRSTQRPSAWSILRDILRHEGWRGLYRGLLPTMTSTGPTMAVNYGTYETLRELYLRRRAAAQAAEKRGNKEERRRRSSGVDHTTTTSSGVLVQPPTLVAMGLGSVTGLVSSAILYPTDLVRRRVQMQGVTNGVTKAVQGGGGGGGGGGGVQVRRSTWSLVMDVWRVGGLRGFYHGFAAEALKVMPGMAIAFMAYEGMKDVLGIQHLTKHR